MDESKKRSSALNFVKIQESYGIVPISMQKMIHSLKEKESAKGMRKNSCQRSNRRSSKQESLNIKDKYNRISLKMSKSVNDKQEAKQVREITNIDYQISISKNSLEETEKSDIPRSKILEQGNIDKEEKLNSMGKTELQTPLQNEVIQGEINRIEEDRIEFPSNINDDEKSILIANLKTNNKIRNKKFIEDDMGEYKSFDRKSGIANVDQTIGIHMLRSKLLRKASSIPSDTTEKNFSGWKE